MSPNPTKEELKAAYKDAIKELVIEQFTDVSRWIAISALRAIGLAVIGAALYLVFRTFDLESLRPHIR